MSEINIKTQNYGLEELLSRGKNRAEQLPRRLGVESDALRGARILEVGCGFGEQCAALEDMYGAEVTGIDPWPRAADGPFSERRFYQQQDITSAEVLGLGTFDFICSYDVLEHVENPRAALENIFKLLNPGGIAHLKYNLHRGASASHLLKYLDFPWVHLIHDDAEIRRLMKERTGQNRGAAWVNHLTYAHYLHYFSEIGFDVSKTWYTLVRMPREFYLRHIESLKVYPIEDLERNFMHATLSRPQ